eukprot:2455818-Rhodomonas_salina.1
MDHACARTENVACWYHTYMSPDLHAFAVLSLTCSTTSKQCVTRCMVLLRVWYRAVLVQYFARRMTCAVLTEGDGTRAETVGALVNTLRLYLVSVAGVPGQSTKQAAEAAHGCGIPWNGDRVRVRLQDDAHRQSGRTHPLRVVAYPLLYWVVGMVLGSVLYGHGGVVLCLGDCAGYNCSVRLAQHCGTE